MREHDAELRVANCENGHVNPESQHFCGDCGIPMVATTSICPAGHMNLDHRPYCGDCGAPTAAPEGISAGSSGKWTVDPTGRHQFRYWDGSGWLDHVADSASMGIDPFVATSRRRPENWIGIVAGVVTVLLLIGAVVQIAIQLSKDDKSEAQTQPSTSAEAAPAPSPSVAAPPTIVQPPGPTIIASPCSPNTPNGETADGSVAYCERLLTTNTYLWSISPGDIAFPAQGDAVAGQPDDPSIGVCMAQLSRTRASCMEYLHRS